MMRKVAIWSLVAGIVVLMFAASIGFVAADDRIDRIESMNIESSCKQKADLVFDGIVARGRHYTVDEWIDSVEDYMREQQEFYRGLTPAARVYVTVYLTQGWKMAERRIVAKLKEANENEVGEFKGLIADLPMSEMLDDTWIERVTDEYYGSCVMQRTTRYDTGLMHANFVKVQSENLPAPVNTYGLWNSVTACMLNRGTWFHQCRKGEKVHSEAQIGAMIKKCEQVIVNKFYDCTGLYPKEKAWSDEQLFGDE